MWTEDQEQYYILLDEVQMLKDFAEVLNSLLHIARQLEIDFVANLGSRRYYVQSAFRLPDREKEEQEKASLLNVNDSFKKLIIVKDIIKVQHDENGITTMSIFDFLLKENSLEL